MASRQGIAKRIVIVNRAQFGYHTDTYMYCRYLAAHYRLTVVCWDQGNSRIALDGVNVVYVSPRGGWAARYLRFIKAASAEIHRDECALALVVYFKMCFAIGLACRNRRVVMDIRSGNLTETSWLRHAFNILIRLEGGCFSETSVISAGLRTLLRLNPARCRLLPLGGERLDVSRSAAAGMRLVYVGTFYRRQIEKTIEGLSRFVSENPGYPITYTIIGFGSEQETAALRTAIQSGGVEQHVRLAGRVPRNELDAYLADANVGIAFVPITEYFDAQPPTKTFEYLLSGMPVIATETSEHKAVITPVNGELIGDSSDDFYRGLERLKDSMAAFREEDIKDSVKAYTWRSIMDTYLIDIIERPLGGRS